MDRRPHRNDPFWGGGVNDLYAGRYRGDYLRPPTTLIQQTTVINNITNNSTTIQNGTSNLNNVTMLTQLKGKDRVGNMQVQNVTADGRQQHQMTAKTLRDTGTRRLDQETQLLKTGGGASKLTVPQTASLDVPHLIPPVRPAPGAGAAGTLKPSIAPGAPAPTALGKPVAAR